MATTSMDHQSSNMFGVVFIAAAAGALAGLLLAPKRGSEMRGDLNRHMMDMHDKVHGKVSDTKDTMAEGAETMRTKAHDIADKAKETVSRKADDAKDGADKLADSTKEAADRAAAETRRKANS